MALQAVNAVSFLGTFPSDRSTVAVIDTPLFFFSWELSTEGLKIRLVEYSSSHNNNRPDNNNLK